MPKCTLRSPKTITGEIGKKIFFSKKKTFFRIFFQQILYHFRPRWKQDATGGHGSIRNEFSMRVGTHEIFQLNDMSEKLQKQDFWP